MLTVGRDEYVQQYLTDLDNMHKVRAEQKILQECELLPLTQVVLEVPGEKELRAATEKLAEAGIQVL